MSKRFTLNNQDGKDLLKVFMYTAGTALIVGLLAVTQDLPIEIQQLWWFPMVNMLLVALKKFFSEKLEG